MTTKPEVLAMARESGFAVTLSNIDSLERFYTLVAAKEREECAKDRRKLADDLTDGFIAYQYRLDYPTPSFTETKETQIARYRTDPIFHAKVNSLVSGVLSIIDRARSAK